MRSIIKSSNAFLILCFFTWSAYAQTKVQMEGLSAPKGIKTDGKNTEWGKLQAHNNSIDADYTIANDDEKLYLVLEASDLLSVRKIIAGGVTLTISPGSEKSSNQAVTITYPLFSQKNWPNINLKDKPDVAKDVAVTRRQLDSFARVVNAKFSNQSKEIKILGSKLLDDTLLSVYNEKGIKVSAAFNNNLVYCYELAIPLKYLGLSTNSQSSFRYDIKINGSSFAEGNIIESIEGGTRVRTVVSAPLVPMRDMQYFQSATNVSGVYTLAKSK